MLDLIRALARFLHQHNPLGIELAHGDFGLLRRRILHPGNQCLAFLFVGNFEAMLLCPC
ncbi:MAG: hypothetical protein ABI365_10425 [Lysobacteraceae bacterium]